MRFGIVGLGRMGANIARNALDNGHEVVGYNRTPQKALDLARDGLEPASSLEELIGKLPGPRVILLYVAHGEVTQAVCDGLLPLVDAGDTVVDAGNSHWEDSRRRHGAFATRGARFIDVGTSGGVEGARNGACFMAGGEREAFDTIAPLLRDLAVDERAVVYAGGPGAGHFTKLVHNAIEFGMIQSIAEGVELLQRSEFGLDLPRLLETWNHGSVIRSWLIELMAKALTESSVEGLSTYVEDTGEVKWVVTWAVEQDIPTPVISQAQQALMEYRDADAFAAKAVALLRNQFGEHPVHLLDEERGSDQAPRV